MEFVQTGVSIANLCILLLIYSDLQYVVLNTPKRRHRKSK